MATSAIPALIDALVLKLTNALPGIIVSDGIGNFGDTGDFLMIGVDDPDKPDAATTASSQQAWASANHTTRDESGEITCAALSWNGDAGAKAARDAVFATCAAVENLLRQNPSLDVPGLLWTSYGTNTTLTQDQTTSATAMVVFSVYFRARI